MIVVSDTTPLISLMKADCLRLLSPLFQEVLIPQSVYLELTANPAFTEEASQIKNSTFIRVVTVKEQKSVELLRRVSGLDLGESEAIVFADDVKADVLLMDEAKGRAVAKTMGIYIMGTIGILLFAHEEKLLSAEKARLAIEKLKEADRHISDDRFRPSLGDGRSRPPVFGAIRSLPCCPSAAEAAAAALLPFLPCAPGRTAPLPVPGGACMPSCPAHGSPG